MTEVVPPKKMRAIGDFLLDKIGKPLYLSNREGRGKG
jgi:hypothetical protein